VSNRIRTAVALVATLALTIWSVPAVAASTAMNQLIDVLRADGTISHEAYEALQAALAADDAQRTTEVEEAAASASASVRDELKKEIDEATTNANLSHRGTSFRMNEDSNAFTLGIGGRVHVDNVWYGEDDVEFSSGAEVRRARIDIRGTVWDDWSFFAGFDMAPSLVALRGMGITFSGFERFKVNVGQVKEPFGLDEITGSNYTSFMERAPVSDILSPGRNIGAAISGSGDHWSSKAGIFWAENSLGGDLAGLSDRDGSWAVTGRQTFTPINEPRRVVHFGAAGSYRSGGDIGTIRYRARPGSHVTNVRLVNTGTITKADRTILYGAEFAASLGPFFLQSEYIGSRIERDSGMPTLDFDGYYAQASWYVTGESRPYKTSRALFGPIRPRRNFDLDEGGPGAWEVALRYSNFDLNSEEIEGGKQDLVTVGLNWYPNPNVRFMLNYVKVLDVDRRGSIFDDEQMSSIGLRSQITF